jgi:alpha-amylase
VVAVNNTEESRTAVVPADALAEGKELNGLITGDRTEEKNGEYEFILDRETAEIYETVEKTGPNIPLISVFIAVPVLFAGFLYRNRRKRT